MVWKPSDQIQFISTLGEPLVYDLEGVSPENYKVIVNSFDYSYEGRGPQHKGFVVTFVTTVSMKEGVHIRLRDRDLTITGVEAQADGFYLVRGTPL